MKENTIKILITQIPLVLLLSFVLFNLSWNPNPEFPFLLDDIEYSKDIGVFVKEYDFKLIPDSLNKLIKINKIWLQTFVKVKQWTIFNKIIPHEKFRDHYAFTINFLDDYKYNNNNKPFTIGKYENDNKRFFEGNGDILRFADMQFNFAKDTFEFPIQEGFSFKSPKIIGKIIFYTKK